MSHYSKMKVNFKDANVLKDALLACGVPAQHITVGAPTVPYETYNGRVAGQCHVKIARSYLGSMVNDAAFILHPEGQSEMLLDGTSRLGVDFPKRIVKEYAVAATVKHYASQGAKVHRKNGVDGRIHMFVKA